MSGELHIAALSTTTSAERLRELFTQRPSLGRLLAQNPASPADLLEKLAAHPDPEVNELVVLNPNTPAPLLFSLGQRFPKQLLKNPMFPLLLLESPNLYTDMPEQTLAGLLSQDGIPEQLLEWAISHKSHFIRLAVAHNQASTAAILQRLSTDREVAVRRAVGVHPRTPIESLSRLATDPAQEIRQLIARNPRTPPSALEMLIGDIAHEVRRYALHNENTPKRMAQALCRAGASRDLMKLYGAPDRTLPEEELRYLSQGGARARELAARHPNVSREMLAVFCKDELAEVRRAVAQHARTPEAQLCALAADPDHDVRWFVAKNPNTPQDILQKLSAEERIAWEIASDPKTPVALLRALASRKSRFMNECLRKNPSTPRETLEQLQDD